MAKQPKFTFKTTKPKGPYASFFPTQHDIKLNKIEVGFIEDKAPFKIKLKVIKADIMEDGNKNCSWKWITLSKQSTTLDESKTFLQENTTKILEKYNIYIPIN